MFLMDIAQSDNADRLLRDLDMLKDDALEAADEAVRAPDPALSDLCDALRWIAVDGIIQAITAVTGAWTPRGLLLTATVTVATGPSEVKIIEHVPLALAQGGPLLEYVSQDPDTLSAALITRWSPGHSFPLPVSGTPCSGTSTQPARRPRPPTPKQPRRYRSKRSPSSSKSPSASSCPPTSGQRGTAYGSERWWRLSGHCPMTCMRSCKRPTSRRRSSSC